LNTFKQKGIIEGEENVKFEQDPSNEQHFKCTIKVKLINECQLTSESGYLPKKIAEEKACEYMFIKMKPYVPCLRGKSGGIFLIYRVGIIAEIPLDLKYPIQF